MFVSLIVGFMIMVVIMVCGFALTGIQGDPRTPWGSFWWNLQFFVLTVMGIGSLGLIVGTLGWLICFTQFGIW